MSNNYKSVTSNKKKQKEARDNGELKSEKADPHSCVRWRLPTTSDRRNREFKSPLGVRYVITE